MPFFMSNMFKYSTLPFFLRLFCKKSQAPLAIPGELCYNIINVSKTKFSPKGAFSHAH